jgi:phage terminase small subunit
VKEYIIDFNASRAALKAKYSKKTASRMGSENLHKPLIQKAIQKEIEKRELRVERTSDEVLLRLWAMQDIDYSDYSEKRQVKTIELLMRHHGLFEKDNTQGGISEALLAAILGGLSSPEMAEKVKKAIIAHAKAKK